MTKRSAVRNESSLTERRAADRAKMADKLAEAVRAAGATATVGPAHSPRSLCVLIAAPGGAGIRVGFNGDSCQPDVHVATWNTPKRVFMNPDIGDVNSYHFGKATRVCSGFDLLVEVLVRDVRRFVDGTGYLTDADPRIVRLRQMYAENGWQW